MKEQIEEVASTDTDDVKVQEPENSTPEKTEPQESSSEIESPILNEDKDQNKSED